VEGNKVTRRPPDPALVCPETDCGERLQVIESGWIDPPALEGLDPDVATYILECPRTHQQFQFTTGGLLRPIVG
jgi:hypothetical protein